MPLPPPVEREHLHTRRIDLRGYRRTDGLWDIDGHMTDTKTYSFANEHRGEIRAGEPLHDMWLRVTIDEEFVVQDIEAVTDGAPFQICGDVTPNFKRLIGTRMRRGWRQQLRERLGGIEGCTHLVETLGAFATVAYQTLWPVLAKKDRPRPGRPPLIDSCYAFRADGPVVKKRWPEFHTGGED